LNCEGWEKEEVVEEEQEIVWKLGGCDAICQYGVATGHRIKHLEKMNSKHFSIYKRRLLVNSFKID